jgi:hypothetical protein
MPAKLYPVDPMSDEAVLAMPRLAQGQQRVPSMAHTANAAAVCGTAHDLFLLSVGCKPWRVAPSSISGTAACSALRDLTLHVIPVPALCR